MIKIVNPMFKGNDEADLANNCRCVCSAQKDNNSSGSSGAWLPWNTCGCACNGTTSNSSGNSNMSKG